MSQILREAILAFNAWNPSPRKSGRRQIPKELRVPQSRWREFVEHLIETQAQCGWVMEDQFGYVKQVKFMGIVATPCDVKHFSVR